MSKEILLSLCIPTNGVVEWVVQVLESIYNEDYDKSQFEVIITDNGENDEFEKVMKEYCDRYNNCVYKKTSAKMFLNQIEAFKLARGKLIKFVNHRMTLVPGAVEYLCEFVKNNSDSKPVVYFSNGVLKLKPIVKVCGSFDEFVMTMSYWSSWSAGTAIWKKDFDKMDLNKEFNKLFPHTDIVFYNKEASKYIVDDSLLLYEIPSDNTKKGNYDLFNAFAVEYPSIIYSLFKERNITLKTYNTIIRKNSFFVSELYYEYIIRKNPCSYNLDGYENSIGKYYGNFEIKSKAIYIRVKLLICNIVKRINNAKRT